MASQEIGRRRNGKQQACEPCRKSKQRCDHSYPHCARCISRGTTIPCIYHPAPMTQGYRPDSDSQSNIPSTAGKRTYKPSPSPSPPPNSAGERRASLRSPGTLFKRCPASYGPTSFSAVYSENQEHFGHDLFDVSATVDADTVPDTPPGDALPHKKKKTSRTLDTLAMFPSRPTCDRLLAAYGSMKDPKVPMPLVRTALAGMWDTFGDCLTPPLRDARLAPILDVLNANELRPWHSLLDASFGSWPDICVGPLLRWEMLGILFTFFGMAFMQLQDWDPLFKTLDATTNTRRKAAWRMKRAADSCLLNCEATDALNDLVVYLMFQIMFLESICVGDESYQISRRHADLASAVMALGLHRLPATRTVRPETEYQRRVFILAFNIDKSHSSFNGRPPMLSRHYCVPRTPLDLSDEQLSSGTEALEMAVARLDERGWNTEGRIHSITMGRARFFLGMIREEVLEIVLGTDVKVDIDCINHILERLEATVASFPPQLQYGNPAPNHGGEQGFAFYSQSMLRLEYLQNRFLLERLKVQRAASSSQGLFDVAWEMMNAVLAVWFRKDELIAFNEYFDWLLVAYGIPCSGILSLTALTCAQATRTPFSSQPSSQQTTTSATSSQSQPRNPALLRNIVFSLPATIQSLTHFLAFLSWSRETDGNYLLCRRLRTVIQRIVDALLKPPGAGTAPPGSQGSVRAASVVGVASFDAASAPTTQIATPLGFGIEIEGVGVSVGFGFEGEEFGIDPFLLDDADCLDWLESVDWTQDGWMDGGGAACAG